jgi:hypothetical protein
MTESAAVSWAILRSRPERGRPGEPFPLIHNLFELLRRVQVLEPVMSWRTTMKCMRLVCSTSKSHGLAFAVDDPEGEREWLTLRCGERARA